MIEQCAVFQSNTTPTGANDLEKVELREGARETGIGPRDDIKEDDGGHENPQDCGVGSDETEETKRYGQFPPVPSFAHRPTTESNLEELRLSCLKTRYEVFSYNKYAIPGA